MAVPATGGPVTRASGADGSPGLFVGHIDSW